MNIECENCIKRKTMFCPNSSKCWNTEDKPYWQNRIMLLEENQQLKEENKILRENAEHNDKVVDKVHWENQQLKGRIDELENWLKGFTTEEFNYNFLVVRIKDVLDKISELKGEKNE